MTILKKLVATTGKYTTADGVEKKRYTTIGHMHEGSHGDYITLDPGISLAGIYAQQVHAGLVKPGDGRLFVNLYDDEKNKEGSKARRDVAPQANQSDKNEFDDDIPF